ncbi:MAG: hypothetical protein CME62_11995 [Halobacteriovoraceae bacterium]|nr:hypothetical protein [Halobacteriovoraceae bacterium]|tara:strand:- start:32463 stop:32768 length:306 start_codon:yes stop_codon:yes gene_type:complete
MTSRNQKIKLRTKAKNNILKIAPHIKSIEVQIAELEPKTFKTKIQAHVPPKKVLVAAKKDENLHLSIEKAQEAILKQIQKHKARSKKRKRPWQLSNDQGLL